MITLTGKTAEEVVEILGKRLEDNAYKAVPHASYLTEIKPAYVREALTEAFGIIGYGWFLDVRREDLEIETIEKKKIDKNTGEISSTWTEYDATIVLAELRFRYKDPPPGDEIHISYPVITTASSSNRSRGDAIEGAITNALGKAAKKLLFQLDIYKGLFSHKDLGKKESGNGRKKKGKKGSAAPDPNGAPLSPEELADYRSRAITGSDNFTPTEFWVISKSLRVDKADADAIIRETDGWADALVGLIDAFGGPDVEQFTKKAKKTEEPEDEIPF